MADPKITTKSICPIMILMVQYSHRFPALKPLISAANVLTVVRHPQYPSPNPCNIEHAFGDTGFGNPCRMWNKASNDVPTSLTTSVPTGSSALRGFNKIETT